MDVPIVGEIVDFFTRAFGIVLVGIVSYRVMIAISQDNDLKIWAAVFWGFIAFGFIVMGKDVFGIFQTIWNNILN